MLSDHRSCHVIASFIFLPLSIPLTVTSYVRLSSWFGIHSSVLNLFKSYLSSRRFRVKCDKAYFFLWCSSRLCSLFTALSLTSEPSARVLIIVLSWFVTGSCDRAQFADFRHQSDDNSLHAVYITVAHFESSSRPRVTCTRAMIVKLLSRVIYRLIWCKSWVTDDGWNLSLCWTFRNAIEPVFTARCTTVQSAVLRSHVVCPSVCL